VDVFEAIIKRRTVKRFMSRQIFASDLPKLIHAANTAQVNSSGCNQPEFQITLIQNVNLLEKITLATSEFIARSGIIDESQLLGAPALMVLSASMGSIQTEHYTIGMVAQSIVLAATSMGLSSAILPSMVYALREAQHLCNELRLPPGYWPCICIAIGYADEKYTVHCQYKEHNVNRLI